MHMSSYSINFMLNSFFKQIEKFTYSNFTETCCPELILSCGCIRLSCECRFVNPKYPAVSFHQSVTRIM